MSNIKRFGELTIGSVVNYNNHIVADDINYVVLYHYEDQWGKSTKVLNMNTLELDDFMSHTKIETRWSIVKEQII